MTEKPQGVLRCGYSPKPDFFSIVEHREQVDLMIVRARRAAHLQSLFPGAEVLETKNADYRFGAFIHRDRVKDALAATVDELNYSNFQRQHCRRPIP